VDNRYTKYSEQNSVHYTPISKTDEASNIQKYVKNRYFRERSQNLWEANKGKEKEVNRYSESESC
jgi:hypothetical protein